MNNPQVGELIDLSASSVSRLRSGFRRPTLETMRAVETVFDWPLTAQLTALDARVWPAGFEAALTIYETDHAAPSTIPE